MIHLFFFSPLSNNLSRKTTKPSLLAHLGRQYKLFGCFSAQIVGQRFNQKEMNQDGELATTETYLNTP